MELTLVNLASLGFYTLSGALGVYLCSRLVSAGWHRSKFAALARFERQIRKVIKHPKEEDRHGR